MTEISAGGSVGVGVFVRVGVRVGVLEGGMGVFVAVRVGVGVCVSFNGRVGVGGISPGFRNKTESDRFMMSGAWSFLNPKTLN